MTDTNKDKTLCEDLAPVIDETFNEIWNWAVDHVVAEVLAPNVTLFTKDGSKIGNAIIIKSDGSIDDCWLIETDFGNRTKITSEEIYRLFTLGYAQSYTSWDDARLNKIETNTLEDLGMPVNTLE